MRCPVCESSDLAISSREGVEIDYCPQCRGVWLDRGELDKILVRERQLAGGEDADEDFFREVEGRGRREGRVPDTYEERPRRRKRGLLEDLLDFD